MNYTPDQIKAARQDIWEYYRDHARDMPWRNPEPNGSFDPYKIMVSEIMLQQTQVARVIPKYEAFLQQFSSVRRLADAPLSEVLAAWSGLGYNRRAKFLQQAAQAVANNQKGRIPDSFESLVALPGIGEHTAGAIMAYAYNQPVVFIETNIRTVLIYHFFVHHDEVHDKELKAVMRQLLDAAHPREFYWALMDYGAYLKQVVGNVSRSAAGYKKQSVFEGSHRQLRGRILRELLQGGQDLETLSRTLRDERLFSALGQLQKEALVVVDGAVYRIA